MFENKPLFVIKFLFFSQHTVLVFEKLCFAENTIKIVFSAKHSFSKTQFAKPTLSPMSKNTFFKRKVSFLVLANFRWNHYFHSFSWFTLFWAKTIFWPKQIVCTKLRVFSPFLTQIVSGNFCQKSIFLIFHIFAWPPQKNTIFIGFFGLFPFSFFSFFFFFLFLFLQHKKDKNKKCNFLSKTSFLTSPKFCKNTILAQCDTICVFKNAPKTL